MNFRMLTSPSNTKIKEALDIKQRTGKRKSALFTIEGPHIIEMAIGSGSRITRVFFTDEFRSKKDGQELLGRLTKNTGEIFEVSAQAMRKIAETETPQGIIAISSYKEKKLDELAFKSIPLIVIVDGVQEPGNLGTIIRTSDATGADAVVILKGTCDAFSQKTIRSTAGSLFNIPIIHSETAELLSWLKTNKIQLAATALDSEKSVFDADLTFPTAFVFGNEAHGISNQMRKNSDLILKIPIHGKAESLNVSAAAAVCLYEAVRQRIPVKS